MILEETPERIKVIENPLARTAPVVLDRADIEERAKSPNFDHAQGLARQADARGDPRPDRLHRGQGRRQGGRSSRASMSMAIES